MQIPIFGSMFTLRAAAAAVVLFIGNIFIVSTAFAHEECVVSSSTEAACGACRCRLEERPAQWILCHDKYWACFDFFHNQIGNYNFCLGAVRECERRASAKKKKKKGYVAFIENPNVTHYPFKQHPVEDAGGNVDEACLHAEACEVQVGSQVLPEVSACFAHLAWCQSL